MLSFLRILAILAALCFPQVLSLGATDEYRDADVEQSGYLPNHNMDPAIVDSSSFGLLWKVAFNKDEQFYAKPLTYTPLAGGPQLLFLASSMNYIRTLNAETGALINARQTHTPFLQSDIGCTDIPNYIGIIGTPVIDPATDIVYFYSKTYIPNFRVNGNTGTSNGVYYFHAVNINTLEDVYPPILIDGTSANNAPAKYFVGGVVLQRPSLTQIGNIVYGAFGGHCDLFNYTGLVIGIDINQGKVVTQWATESGPLIAAAQTNDLLQNGGGGQGGIWMSGMGLASDGERLFFVTGNGDAHTNNGAPASGTSGCQTLGEAAINLALNNTGDGKLSLSDYFQPWDYQNMDAADQDFGSGGIVLLDPNYFSGGNIAKMAVTAGKNGKVYILNANNLGGFKLGVGQTDGIIQTIVTNEAVFGAAGSYPLEGGFIYLTPVGYPTYAYSLGFTSTGTPQFSQVGATNETSTGRVGVGIPTITTLNGQAGTAILWMTDPTAGLRAWYAVPQGSVLIPIPLPQVGGANKFQRPAFGDGRVYTTDTNGILYCLGAPVNLPLNCTSPVDFGNVALGSAVTKSVTCKANILIDSLDGLEVGDGFFQASNSSLPEGKLAAGESFTFPVTWNLTTAEIKNTPNASSGSVSPGVKSTPLTLYTTNGISGYTTVFPISLTGSEVSTAPFLTLSPKTLDYGGIVLLNNESAIPSVSDVITIANSGLNPLTILGYAFTTDELISSPTFTNSTVVNGTWNLGLGFSAQTLPAIGSVIPANTAISVDSTFEPVNGVGSYSSYWQVWSSGGTLNIILEGSASTAPIANFSISNGEGGWLPPTNLLMDFGDVAPGSSSSRQIRICNSGGSALEIDKSKPPNGVFHISDPTELEETQLIPPSDCAFGTVLMVANTEEYDEPNLVVNNTWTLNTNDLNFGVHVVEIVGTVVSGKVGPVNESTGSTVYEYLGCFHEAYSGPRLFPNEPLSPSNTNDNGNCQTACYGAAKYAFAGTEYGDECWCGNTPPPLANQVLDTYCNFACPGDGNDACGAASYLSVYYDPTKYVAGTNPALYGPKTILSIGSYVYQGCYSEATTGRALSGKTPATPASGFTIELCEAACVGYEYFGMEYANQCFCGNSLGAGSVNQSSSVPSVNGCDMVCKGNSLEFCGGSALLDLYKLSPSQVSSVSTLISSTISSSISTSSASSRTTSSTNTLSSTSTASTSSSSLSSLSKSSSISTLSSTGTTSTSTSSLSSLSRSSSTSSITSSLSSTSTFTSSASSTSSPSSSSSSSTSASLSSTNTVLSSTSISSSSQSASSTLSSSTLSLSLPSSSLSTILTSSLSSTSKVTTSGTSSLTSTSLLGTSSSSSTHSSSVSSSISTISKVTSSTQSSQCATGCSTSVTVVSVSGSSTSTGYTTVSPSSSTSGSTSSSALAALWTGTPIPGQAIGSWEYLGCVDEVPGRALTESSYSTNTAMTIEACQSFCSENNWAMAGVEYSSQCYCGNELASPAAPGYTGCTFVCTGNSEEFCGGSSRVSVFNNTGYIYPSNPQNVESYVYQGCYHEASTGRLLSGPSYTNDTGMTVESCVEFCKANLPNGVYAGVEYAQECYCSSSLPSSAVVESASSCDMLCKGNNKEYCGGPSLLNVYEYQATP